MGKLKTISQSNTLFKVTDEVVYLGKSRVVLNTNYYFKDYQGNLVLDGVLDDQKLDILKVHVTSMVDRIIGSNKFSFSDRKKDLSKFLEHYDVFAIFTKNKDISISGNLIQKESVIFLNPNVRVYLCVVLKKNNL